MRQQMMMILVVLAFAPTVAASDWPMWGRDGARNMASDESSLPATFGTGTPVEGSDTIDVKGAKNVRWVAKLGSQSYGNVTVASGRVFLGTNNAVPRDPKLKGDYSIVMALDERSGEFLWQLGVPKLGAGKVSDWEFLGICSSPAVDGDVVYVVTNRSEVIALDVRGQANGNQGPFKDEGAYMAGPGKPALPIGARDGDILWRYDMRKDLGVFPHNVTSSSVLVVGDRLFVSTSNGVDWSHRNVPAPFSPALVVLDKKTGALLAEETVGISERTMHANWSSPSVARVGKKDVILFGAGDGFLYGFDPAPVKDAEGLNVLRELWRYDANPSTYRAVDGKPVPYARRNGPSEIIATPAVHGGLACVAIGQDPEHGTGKGSLSCLSPGGKGDRSATGPTWRFDGIGRSISTVAIANGLLVAADLSGRVYGLDAKSGAHLWTHDTGGHIWASPLIADNKIYIGNESGFLTILEAGRTEKVLATLDLYAPIYGSAVAAGGAIYIQTQVHLWTLSSQGTSGPGKTR
jgi:outer membrane protein assembly factor BamB